jgi:hypothetical protein
MSREIILGLLRGGLARKKDRLLAMQKVAGSNPVTRSNFPS